MAITNIPPPATVVQENVKDDLLEAAPRLVHELPDSRQDIACEGFSALPPEGKL